jgi:electron transfer flavoprotein alpha subunit
MSALVLAEHDNAQLSAATAAAVSAASQMTDKIHVLIAGNESTAVAEQAAALSGVSKVLHAQAEHYANPLAENIAPLIVSLADGYTHIVAAATTTGKDIMPRVSALLDVQQVSDIISVESPDTFTRPIYAGNAIEMVQSSDERKVITIRPTAFDKAGSDGSASVETLEAHADAGISSFIELQATASDRPDLSSASRVISGGRGLGSKENFELIERLADKLGAAVGASRAAVDAGYVPNDYQVGQTGKVVAPELYIAVGISGAIQHLAGMKESKVIVAINKDESAPIFEIADYGLVADLFEALPELEKQL